MNYEHILVEEEDGVGIVTLNRPDKLNAMNRRLSSELHDAVKKLEGDEAIGCIVLTGAGSAFCAEGQSIMNPTASNPARCATANMARRPGRSNQMWV